MDNRKMWEAEYHQRQQMRPEHEKKMLEHKEKILESFRHQLGNINIYAKRYGDSMSCYIENPDDFWVQLMDVERVKIISGLRELKLKQERHPKELTELVTQVVASFEDLVGVNLGFEERVEKYKRENNTLKAKIMGFMRRILEPKVPDYTSEEFAHSSKLGVHLDNDGGGGRNY